MESNKSLPNMLVVELLPDEPDSANKVALVFTAEPEVENAESELNVENNEISVNEPEPELNSEIVEVSTDEKPVEEECPNKDIKTPSSASKVKDKQNSRKLQEERQRKKDDKCVENILKEINSGTSDDKFPLICKKYTELYEEFKKYQATIKQNEKNSTLQQREKEALQQELKKSNLVRNCLENLCRELQKQNKLIQEKNLLRVREEEEKRKEVSAKFQTTLNEINSLMQQNVAKNSKLQDQNQDMTLKFKAVCDEFENKEKMMEKLMQEVKLESQLAEAKWNKCHLEMKAEKELLLKEKECLLLEVLEYRKKLEIMQKNEIALRNQMLMYNSKYDEFHKAMLDSNEAITGFTSEMDRMSKQIKRMEKETNSWKNKYDNSQCILLTLSADKLKSDQELQRSTRRLTALQTLCRTLQKQVVDLREQMKDNNAPLDNKEEDEKSLKLAEEVITNGIEVLDINEEECNKNHCHDCQLSNEEETKAKLFQHPNQVTSDNVLKSMKSENLQVCPRKKLQEDDESRLSTNDSNVMVNAMETNQAVGVNKKLNKKKNKKT